MNDFHEEDVIGKAYDSRLMKRLLRYAAPYWKWIFLCIAFLFVITGLELARPYLIKVAIDDHINGFDRPMTAYQPGDPALAETKGQRVEFGGLVFVRDRSKAGMLESYESATSFSLEPGRRYQVIAHDGRFYMVEGIAKLTPSGMEDADITVESTAGGLFVISQGVRFPARELSRDEVTAIRSGDISALVKLGLVFLIIAILAFAFNYAQVYILNWTGQMIIYNMRSEIFSHLQRLHMGFFDKTPVGRLVTRVTNDTETLNEMYTSVLVNLFKDVFMLAGIIIVMLKMNWQLALVTFTVFPLIIAATVVFRTKARDAYRAVRTRLARINATLAENISGMKVIQIFNREAKQYEEFDEINRAYYDASMRELMVYAVFRPVMDFLASFALSVLIWYGGRSVLKGSLEFGVLFAFVNYLNTFFQPISDLTEKYNILQAAMASSERIFQLLDTKPAIVNADSPVRAKRLRGEIEFKNVWFAYNEGEWVLKDVSFKIEPGETVAFVGATGAGKTSIMSLINRFYEIQKGDILIDGVSIKDIALEDLRSNIGMVLQDVFLFTGDIASNIRLNNEEITDDKIRDIAEYVNAARFIDSLDGGYHAEVKERGATFSTGQRQLLAFARALAFDPSILVLDEATANIDTETEQLIQDALLKLIKGRTTIVVAHRLSTIQHADKIIVLHKGRVREIGNHQELLAQRGIYYDLYRLQYKESFAENGDSGAHGGPANLKTVNRTLAPAVEVGSDG